jgi:peptidoglycan/xylan/chitin deacetylase (PgdA/CDA1 family)
MRSIFFVLVALWLTITPALADSLAVQDRLPTSAKQIALTFVGIDNPEALATALTVCRENSIKATLFFSGKFVRENPAMVKDAVAAGHELGNYGVNHQYWEQLTPGKIARELTEAAEILKTVTGAEPGFVRPPYNYYGDNFIAAVGQFNSSKIIVRGIDTGDWTLMSSQAVVAKVNSEAAPGAIININMKASHAAAALPQIIGDLKQQGFKFDTLTALRAAPMPVVKDPTRPVSPFAVINRLELSTPAVALTFDDGGSDSNAAEILSVLAAYKVPATFFLLGSWMEAHPEMTRRIVEAGHEIANHSYNHPRFTYLDTVEMADEIMTTQNAGAAVTGTALRRYFRPPYGEYNSAVVDTVQQLGYQAIVLWNVDSRDWTGIGASAMAHRVTAQVSAGSIVLFHLHGQHTAEALQEMIPEIVDLGYQFATIGSMF